MKLSRFTFVITCVFALAISGTAALATSEAGMTPERFSDADTVVNGLAAFSTIDDLKPQEFPTDELDSQTILNSESSDNNLITNDTAYLMRFEGCTLAYNNQNELVGAHVSDPIHAGPRGLHIGMTAQEVFVLFYRDPNPTSCSVFYSAGTDAAGSQQPPCGYVLRQGDGTFSFIYITVSTEHERFADASRNIELTVNFNTDGKVSSYDWERGPLNE